MSAAGSACRGGKCGSVTLAALCVLTFMAGSGLFLFCGPPETAILIFVSILMSAYGTGLAISCYVSRREAVARMRETEQARLRGHPRFAGLPAVKLDAWAPRTTTQGAPTFCRAGGSSFAGNGDGDMCAVCLEPKECTASGGCRELPCGHTFHSVCLDMWTLEGGR
eukprot:CAMPEP_0170302312 /NCGR_PEP_ID=MMETSP0116_2-20130129/51436_1 /TAXON_ID=400756 /ORGANISM="Durinskia baltica, Strain CSIRO CS-38" /LENGTH=165 /DNA_ID=CAMNT_0010554175 /DNA_START=44 /DNA_END=538 /DNA_ORIENTATION=+